MQDGPTVTDIYIYLRMEQSVVSQHLAILRRANLIEHQRQGKNIYYSINEEELGRVGDIISELSKNMYED